MMNQEQYRKAILSELGITQWSLSAPDILEPSLQLSHPAKNPQAQAAQAKETSTQQKAIQPEQTLSIDARVADLKSSLEASQSQPPKQALSQENGSQEKQVELEKVSAEGKVVVAQELQHKLPEWFCRDLALFLGLTLDDFVYLSQQQEAGSGYVLWLKSHSNSQSHSHLADSASVPANHLWLPEVIEPQSKKSLWRSLQAAKLQCNW